VRCLTHNPKGPPARALTQEGFEIHVDDALHPDTLAGAGHGIDVGYYIAPPFVAVCSTIKFTLIGIAILYVLCGIAFRFRARVLQPSRSE
jgi:hypothetical protein